MRNLQFLILVILSVVLLWAAQATAEDKGSPESEKIIYTKQMCYYCHKIGNAEGNAGPALTKEGNKSKATGWQIKNPVEPSSVHLKHLGDMPKFDKLNVRMFLDLVAFWSH